MISYSKDGFPFPSLINLHEVIEFDDHTAGGLKVWLWQQAEGADPFWMSCETLGGSCSWTIYRLHGVEKVDASHGRLKNASMAGSFDNFFHVRGFLSRAMHSDLSDEQLVKVEELETDGLHASIEHVAKHSPEVMAEVVTAMALIGGHWIQAEQTNYMDTGMISGWLNDLIVALSVRVQAKQ